MMTTPAGSPGTALIHHLIARDLSREQPVTYEQARAALLDANGRTDIARLLLEQATMTGLRYRERSALERAP